MASLRYPDAGSRLVILPSGVPAASTTVTIYEDAAGLQPAEIYEDVSGVQGALIATSQVTTDGYGLLPYWWGPAAGTDRLYMNVSGWPIVAVDADNNSRIDAAEARLTTAEGDVAAVAGRVTATETRLTAIEPGGASAAALDTAVVHLAGDETIAGAKTLTGALSAARLTVAGWTLPLLGPSTRPQLWRQPSVIVSLFQTGHGWTTSGTPGSAELNDTATWCRGTQSARVTTTGGSGVSCGIQRTGMAAMDLTDKALRIVFRLDDPSRIGNINFYVGTSWLANNYKWRFDAETTSSKIVLAGEWATVTLQWSEINSTAGTYSLSAGVPSVTSGFTAMRFEVSDNGTGPLTANLQSIEVIPAPVSEYPNGLVSITFDDGYSTPETLGRAKMDSLGYRGTHYIVAERVGQSEYLTLAQLRTLQDVHGWEIGGHGYAAATHTGRYPALTAQQADDDLCALKAWLLSNGFRGDSFAYPGGRYDTTTDGTPVDQLVAKYFSSGRTILSTVGVSTHVALDCVPAAMPHRLRGMSSISAVSGAPISPSALVASGGVLDKVAGNSGWLIMVFHRITAGAATDPAEISQVDFGTVMDGIAARGMTVLPVGEVIQRAGGA